MSISAVIFDLGSTLVKETGLHPEEAQRFVLSRVESAEKVNVENLRRFSERVFQDMLERRERSGLEFQLAQYLNLAQACLGIRLRGDVDEIAFRCWLLEHVPRLEDGAEECLSRLRESGTRIGLLSNTILSRRSVAFALKEFGVEEYFDAIVCSSEVGYRKPHRLIFEAVLSMVGGSPGESVMVGDSLESDIAGAASLGMKTVWFNPEGRSPSDIKPDHIVSDLRSVPGVLGLG